MRWFPPKAVIVIVVTVLIKNRVYWANGIISEVFVVAILITRPEDFYV